MRVPLSWLQEFVPLSTSPRDVDGVRDLGRVLDSLGLVVEGIEHVGGGLDGVVLARVLEIRPIPGAERIRQVVVDAGGPDVSEIVCGATNFAVGDVVPLARVGAELPGGFVITRRTLRGVVSDGMLCSARELGIGGDGAGLLVLASTGSSAAPLPAGVEPGMALTDHLGIVPDAVLDIAVEPNRPDCLCVAGIARDLAARLGLPFDLEVPAVERSGRPAAELATVAVRAPEACSHLLARVVSGLPPLPSPPEVARRLLLAGMRPIGAVVDASNYVMLELGQPSHPYDLDALGARGLSIRYARPGEELVTLDGVARVLGRHTDALGRTTDVDDLVVCDAADVAVGLAGIMGGAATEIGDATTSVVLEVAQFDPVVVARTAKRQGLRSEASARFERGVDPEGLARAADRFCALVVAAARHRGAPVPVVAPVDLDEHPVVTPRRHVRVRVDRVNALLGTALAAEEVVGLLAPIGFRASSAPRADGDPDAGGSHVVLDVEVPSFRPDAVREVDVVEEVARHVGYERIVPTPRRSPFVGTLGARTASRRRLRRVLAGLGAHEAWTSSIVDPALLERAGSQHPVVELANPMVHEESVLRAHLLPGLLGSLRHNVAHRNPAVRMFEIGRVFSPSTGDGLPVESEHAGVLLACGGDDAASAVHALQVVLDQMGRSPDALLLDQHVAAPEPLLALGTHPSRRALLRAGSAPRAAAGPDGGAGGEVVGVVGEVDPRVLEAYGMPSDRRVGWLVLDLVAFDGLPHADRRARPVSRFPSSDVDLSFLLDDVTPASALESVLRSSGGPLLESVRLLEAYRGPGIAPDRRSLSYRVRFCAPDRTLTDAEVAELRAACIAAAEAALPASLRA